MTHVIDLLKYKRQLEREISDLDWDGKPSAHLQDTLARVNADIRAGKIWEPLF